jgi:hypothetical protein
MPDKEENAFSKLAEGKQKGPISEFWLFIVNNKKWWLTPIIAALILVGVLVVIGGSGVAPFIYSLF